MRGTAKTRKARDARAAQKKADTPMSAPPWWWQINWDCMVYGSPLMMQEAVGKP